MLDGFLVIIKVLGHEEKCRADQNAYCLPPSPSPSNHIVVILILDWHLYVQTLINILV